MADARDAELDYWRKITTPQNGDEIRMAINDSRSFMAKETQIQIEKGIENLVILEKLFEEAVMINLKLDLEARNQIAEAVMEQEEEKQKNQQILVEIVAQQAKQREAIAEAAQNPVLEKAMTDLITAEGLSLKKEEKVLEHLDNHKKEFGHQLDGMLNSYEEAYKKYELEKGPPPKEMEMLIIYDAKGEPFIPAPDEAKKFVNDIKTSYEKHCDNLLPAYKMYTDSIAVAESQKDVPEAPTPPEVIMERAPLLTQLETVFKDQKNEGKELSPQEVLAILRENKNKKNIISEFPTNISADKELKASTQEFLSARTEVIKKKIEVFSAAKEKLEPATPRLG